jgi:hypothetical protein
MGHPLNQNFIPNEPLSRLTADWLNTVARTLNTLAGDGIAISKPPSGQKWTLTVTVDDATLQLSGGIIAIKDGGVDADALAASVAGDGLQGGAGSALAVDVSDFAGAGLEDDGSENLRIAASAAGNGLTGGAGSALAVNVDDSTIEISGDAIRVKNGGITSAKTSGLTGTYEYPLYTKIVFSNGLAQSMSP